MKRLEWGSASPAARRMVGMAMVARVAKQAKNASQARVRIGVQGPASDGRFRWVIWWGLDEGDDLASHGPWTTEAEAQAGASMVAAYLKAVPGTAAIPGGAWSDG